MAAVTVFLAMVFHTRLKLPTHFILGVIKQPLFLPLCYSLGPSELENCIALSKLEFHFAKLFVVQASWFDSQRREFFAREQWSQSRDA